MFCKDPSLRIGMTVSVFVLSALGIQADGMRKASSDIFALGADSVAEGLDHAIALAIADEGDGFA